MPYAVENALFQWEEGERRVRDDARLERAVYSVLDELRRRLGGSFEIAELADLYARDTDWAVEVAQARAGAGAASYVVDAAFGRYAREARDYAGGTRRPLPPPPARR
jgi:hypothetical protein